MKNNVFRQISIYSIKKTKITIIVKNNKLSMLRASQPYNAM